MPLPDAGIPVFLTDSASEMVHPYTPERPTAWLFIFLTLVCVTSPFAEHPVPADFQESPSLRQQVEAGNLPPLSTRLPIDPMVVTPVHETGRYGGTWHRMMRSPSDFHAYGRCVYEQILRWTPAPGGGIQIGPGLAKSWTYADSNTTLILHLRRGLKWSDGHPFSSDDILFWWERIANNRDLSGTLPRIWRPDDVPMRLARIDSHTVALMFHKPYPLALKYLAHIGNQWPLLFERAGFFAPRHYLEPYLPGNPENPHSTTYTEFEERASDFNPNRPVMSAWKVIEWDPGSHLLAERNPYYWKVDSDGNQLPYLDRVEMEIFLNPEMLKFRAVAGILQMQLRHFTSEDRELLQSFSQKRDYTLLEWEGTTVRGIMPNLQYADPVLRKLFLNREFRIALSHAIDRDLINKLCYKGMGTTNRMALHPSSPWYVKVDNLPDYTTYDPDLANRMLDQIGLDKRDKGGFRIGPDGKTVSLIMELYNVQGPEMDAVEIARSNWEAVGLKTAIKPEERTLYHQRIVQNGEHMIAVNGIEGSFVLVNSARWFGTSLWDEWGHHWAEWFITKGERGEEPPPEFKRLQNLQTLLSVTVDEEESKKLWEEVIRFHAENMLVIPLPVQSTSIGVLSNKFGNVPEKALASWVTMTPGYLNPETFYFKR